MGGSELRHYFAIQCTVAGAQSMNKTAVGEAMLTNGGVDLLLPAAAQHGFAHAAIAVSILARFQHCFFGFLECGAAGAAEASRALAPLLVAAVLGFAAGSSSHRGAGL